MRCQITKSWQGDDCDMLHSGTARVVPMSALHLSPIALPHCHVKSPPHTWRRIWGHQLRDRKGCREIRKSGFIAVALHLECRHACDPTSVARQPARQSEHDQAISLFVGQHPIFMLSYPGSCLIRTHIVSSLFQTKLQSSHGFRLPRAEEPPRHDATERAQPSSIIKNFKPAPVESCFRQAPFSRSSKPKR